ncbi:MAG: two-component regulator propeller domain-containing protein [Agriterribacter sp.]
MKKIPTIAILSLLYTPCPQTRRTGSLWGTLLFFLLCLPHCVQAQLNFTSDSNYFIEKINSENGFPQNTVRSIESDSRGFVWLSTELGLVRYDGIHCKVFNSRNTKSMKVNRIISITKNMNNELIALAEDRNAFRINEKTIR